jgi:hypothetical protein
MEFNLIKRNSPAKSTHPRKVSHFGVPVVEGGVKPFKAAGLSIR